MLRFLLTCNVTYVTLNKGMFMAIGKSNRIVIDLNPKLKRELYSALTKRGLTLKEWFEERAHLFINKKIGKNYSDNNGSK